jgi:hypothetical protein
MLRLFRRPPRESFEPDTDEAVPPVGDDDLGPDTRGELESTGRRRRPLKTILACGILAVGLAALYFGWSGGRSDEPAPPRLLPQGRPSLTQAGPPPQDIAPPPVATAPMSSRSGAPALSPGPGAPPAQQTAAPTFYVPLQRDPREAAPAAGNQESSVLAGGPYNALAQASHEATVENLRTQIAELRLKKLKAELEADGLRKNPRRLFKEDKPPAESKTELRPLERLARVPPPLLAMPGPVPLPAQPQAPAPPAQPASPPRMRVRMVTLDPKEALMETGDADGRGWFKVREGQKFPDFVVTNIGEDGVTIFFAGRGVFYPVGGYALGAPQDNRQAASRQASEPPHR